MKQQFDHSPKKQKIPGLDGLRGIAILGVIGYHLAPGIFPGGFLGVNLFFVLSGYLMAVTSRRSQAGEGFHALAFYRRRAARIYPALALCVCGTLCAAWLLTPDVLAGIRSEVISILTGTNNWWQIAQNASYFTKITGTSPFTPVVFGNRDAVLPHLAAAVLGIYRSGAAAGGRPDWMVSFDRSLCAFPLFEFPAW
mgnify:CR=1 FL=1